MVVWLNELSFLFQQVFPSLMIFIIIYGLLQKLKLFGEKEGKRINLLIALSFFIFSLVFIKDILWIFGIAGILMLLTFFFSIVYRTFKKE